MEVEFWASRVQSANNFSAVQYAHLNNPDDEMRAWFPCPFCYIEIEVPAFCLHLQEEHCFNLNNAVCPICAANLGKDATGHFTTQHAHLVKRRRKSQKSGLWNSNSSMIPGKDMQERNTYRGPEPMDGRGNMHENAPDPLLSPFLCSISLPYPEEEISCNSASTTSKATSIKSIVLNEAQEKDYTEQRRRAAFAQELIFSTIF